MRKTNPYVGSETPTAYARRRAAKSPEFAQAFAEEYDRLKVAREIRKAREKQKLSQSELAKRIGTKQPHIARLERGSASPRLEILHKIAGALNLHLDVRFVSPRARPAH